MKTGAVDLFSASVYNCIKSYFIVTFIIVKYCEIADAAGIGVPVFTIKYTFQ